MRRPRPQTARPAPRPPAGRRPGTAPSRLAQQPRVPTRSGQLGTAAAAATAARLLRLRKSLPTSGAFQPSGPRGAANNGALDGAAAARHTVAVRKRAEAACRREQALRLYKLRRARAAEASHASSLARQGAQGRIGGGLLNGAQFVDLNTLDTTGGAQLPQGRILMLQKDALVRAMSTAKRALMTLAETRTRPSSPSAVRGTVVGAAQMTELWDLYTAQGRFREWHLLRLARAVAQLARASLRDAMRSGGAIAKRSWQWDHDEELLASACAAAEAQLAALERDPAGYLWQLYPGDACFLTRLPPGSSSGAGEARWRCTQEDFVSKAAAQLFTGGDFDLANLVPQLLDRLVSSTKQRRSSSSSNNIFV